MKGKTTNEDQLCDFITLFDQELKLRLAKIINERRIIKMFDRASIHKTKELNY